MYKFRTVAVIALQNIKITIKFYERLLLFGKGISTSTAP